MSESEQKIVATKVNRDKHEKVNKMLEFSWQVALIDNAMC